MTTINTLAIIDDDDIYQYGVKKTLSKAQLVERIVTFSDGQEALDFFAANLDNPDELPDLVFLDLNMPIIDGWQFLEHYSKLRDKINKKITIFVTSSSRNPDDLMRAKNIDEVCDYIVKPFTLERFREIIER